MSAKGLSSRTSALEMKLFGSEQNDKVLFDRIVALQDKKVSMPISSAPYVHNWVLNIIDIVRSWKKLKMVLVPIVD